MRCGLALKLYAVSPHLPLSCSKLLDQNLLWDLTHTSLNNSCMHKLACGSMFGLFCILACFLCSQCLWVAGWIDWHCDSMDNLTTWVCLCFRAFLQFSIHKFLSVVLLRLVCVSSVLSLALASTTFSFKSISWCSLYLCSFLQRKHGESFVQKHFFAIVLLFVSFSVET